MNFGQLPKRTILGFGYKNKFFLEELEASLENTVYEMNTLDRSLTEGEKINRGATRTAR